jgi:RNA polymerase primary sigma factor
MLRKMTIAPTITRRSDELTAYLNDIARYQPLTADEEIELAEAMRNGDAAAKDRFVKANLRFVVSVAKQYQGMGLDLLDLINEGNFGLLNAVEKFDETRGFKFISFAVFEIRAAITAALCDKSRLVRVPAKKVGEVENVSVSMDAPIGGNDDENKTYLGTFASDNRTDSGFDLEDAKVILNRLLSKLDDTTAKGYDPKDRKIICAIFGIGCREYSEYEVSLMFNITKERVRQKKFEIIEKLRKYVA